MKIGTPTLKFEPRRWQKPEHGLMSTNPLEAEHPTFVRALDFMCMGTDLGLYYTPPQGAERMAAAGLGALTSAGLALWGVTKLKHGETALDKVEAVGSLGLSFGYGVDTVNALKPLGKPGQWASNVGMGVFAGSSVFLGGVDAVRGAREKAPSRLVSGLAQIATGVCVAGMIAAPAATGPLLWGVVGATVARELAVGLPGQPLTVL